MRGGKAAPQGRQQAAWHQQPGTCTLPSSCPHRGSVLPVQGAASTAGGGGERCVRTRQDLPSTAPLAPPPRAPAPVGKPPAVAQLLSFKGLWELKLREFHSSLKTATQIYLYNYARVNRSPHRLPYKS